MKKAISISFALCFSLTAISQSYITKNEYSNEPVLINPASCGADLIPKATLSYEKQWLYINQAPSSFYASGEIRLGKFDFYNPRMYLNESKFKSLERVGLGAGIYTDINGPYQETNFLLTYSYHIPVSEGANLSFGITAKLNHYGTNSSGLEPRDIDDPLISFDNFTSTNTSVGAYLYHAEYFAGISGVNLFSTEKQTINYFDYRQVLYGIAGYRFRNENGSLILEPSITGKYYLSEQLTQFDYHVKLYFPKYGWLSFSQISDKHFELVFAIRARKALYIAYKFASVQKEMSTYTNYTHGIKLGMNLGVSRNTAIIY